MKKFKKGNKVKITDIGYCYTTYDTMFKKLGFKDTKCNNYEDSFVKLTWEVVKTDLHEDGVNKLAFIKSGDKELLISFKGIIKEPTTDIIEIVEKYGKDKVISLIEKCKVMKKTLRELLQSQIKDYNSQILHFDKLIKSYAEEGNYQRCYFYQVKREQLLHILKDLNSLL